MQSRAGRLRRITALCAALTVSLACPRVARAIYDGSPVAFRDYPFFATLILSNSPTFTGGVWVCGSTLIHESFIITAAHCTIDAVAAYVYLNSSVSLSPWIPGPAFYATEIHTNPAYDSFTIYNDVGLVKLPTPMPGIPRLTPAQTPAQWLALQTCALLDVLGRGQTCGGGCLSNDLQRTRLPKIPFDECAVSDYSDDTKWAAAVVGADLCLGFENSCYNRTQVSTTCRGDSGGPGFVGSVLHGIVSRGPVAVCGADARRADIFVNLVDPLNKAFIESVTLTEGVDGQQGDDAASPQRASSARVERRAAASLVASLLALAVVVLS
jgi:secreted trypsin-like serine protease